MENFRCLLCGSETSIKENDRFSSILCDCRIVIYYFATGQNIVITKSEYLDYKKRKMDERNGV